MTCNKPYWKPSVTEIFSPKGGVWSTATINGTTYITVDGAPTYHLDGKDWKEVEGEPLSMTLEANIPKEYVLHPGHAIRFDLDLKEEAEDIFSCETDNITSMIYQMVEENDSRDKSIGGLENSCKDNRFDITHLEKEVEILMAEVDRLQNQMKNKLDKPSVAPELINAEAYIDDYMQAERKMKRDRHARKQRIQGKLARIERLNKEAELKTKRMSKGLVTAGIATVAGAAVVAAMWVGLIPSWGF